MGGIRLQEKSIVQKYLQSTLVTHSNLSARRVVKTNQNIDILANITLRMRLDDLLDSCPWIKLLACCHCSLLLGFSVCGGSEMLSMVLLFSFSLVTLGSSARRPMAASKSNNLPHHKSNDERQLPLALLPLLFQLPHYNSCWANLG